MFSTSADVLNLVLALAIAILTFFLSLSLYYFISSAQRIHKLIKQVELGVSKAEEVISLVREKVKSSSAYMVVLAEVAKQAMAFARNKDWSRKESKSDTKTNKTK